MKERLIYWGLMAWCFICGAAVTYSIYHITQYFTVIIKYR
jgi:hypothetical protein